MRGDAADAFKTYLSQGTVNMIQGLLDVSSEMTMIIQLITEYPEFKAMYQQAYEICRNMEALMGIFSEELRIMDRNTVKYMVDQMQGKMKNRECLVRMPANSIFWHFQQ